MIPPEYRTDAPVWWTWDQMMDRTELVVARRKCLGQWWTVTGLPNLPSVQQDDRRVPEDWDWRNAARSSSGVDGMSGEG